MVDLELAQGCHSSLHTRRIPLRGKRPVVRYMPFRGRTYSLWGFACVKLTLGRKVIRVGTDDADELVKVFASKTGSGGSHE